jgi:hypothetical protein
MSRTDPPLRGNALQPAEAEGLEPPRAFTRLISNQLPYQLDYASSIRARHE